MNFDGDGLFIPGQSRPDFIYSIVIESINGCSYRSSAFAVEAQFDKE